MEILKTYLEEQLKILPDKPFNIGKNPKYNGSQGALASIVYKYLIKTRFACTVKGLSYAR